jgi:hypothetical protein
MNIPVLCLGDLTAGQAALPFFVQLMFYLWMGRENNAKKPRKSKLNTLEGIEES